MLWKYLNLYKSTLCYLLLIILLGNLFSITPRYYLAGELFSPLDGLVGAIYVFRNFSQRETGHWVLLFMAIAGILSYVLAEVADATTYAFIGGELTDLFIFTFMRGPLLYRVYWSALCSILIDSIVFLYAMGHLNWVALSVMTAVKVLTMFIVVIVWSRLKK